MRRINAALEEKKRSRMTSVAAISESKSVDEDDDDSLNILTNRPNNQRINIEGNDDELLEFGADDASSAIELDDEELTRDKVSSTSMILF